LYFGRKGIRLWGLMGSAASSGGQKSGSGPGWLRIVLVVHPIVAIMAGLLTIVSVIARLTEPGAPPPSATPAAGSRLLVTEESALHGWVSDWTTLYGTAPRIDAGNRAQYVVVIYTFAWDSGGAVGYWYVQPFANAYYTLIGSDATWQARARRGSEYGVLVARLQPPLTTAEAQGLAGGPGPGVIPVTAGGCGFSRKLYSFPPPGPGVVEWAYVPAISKWTPILYIGLGGLGIAALLIGVVLWARRQTRSS